MLKKKKYNCIFILIISIVVLSCAAREKYVPKTDAEKAKVNEIQTLLNRPKWWTINNSGITMPGQHRFIFEPVGEKKTGKIFLDIYGTADTPLQASYMCDVEITASGFNLDNCPAFISFDYNAVNPDIPFSGKNDYLKCELKPQY